MFMCYNFLWKPFTVIPVQLASASFTSDRTFVHQHMRWKRPHISLTTNRLTASRFQDRNQRISISNCKYLQKGTRRFRLDVYILTKGTDISTDASFSNDKCLEDIKSLRERNRVSSRDINT